MIHEPEVRRDGRQAFFPPLPPKFFHAFRGGALDATTKGPRRDSEFILRVPAKQAAAPRTATEPQTGGPGLSRRILVVDDNQDSVRLTELLLRAWGHQVKVAYQGATALALAAEYQPEMVLLDIGLPGMNGYEVAQRLKATPGLNPPVLVAVTGYGYPEDRQRSQQAGFDYHLTKPVDPQTLRDVIAAGLPPEPGSLPP